MPRPKGSKNKKAPVATTPVEELDAKIEAGKAEIAKLTEALRVKKAELKKLTQLKEAELRAAAEKKAAEEKAAIIEAFETSGKKVEEVLEFLRNK